MKHIELLLMTIFTSQLREIVRAGRFYITVAPLYRVIKNGVDNIFLNTKKDLDVFFSKELSENFKFTDEDGKELPVKSRAKYVSKLREYRTKLEEYASKYNITPHILETGFINFFNAEEEDFEYPENIEINELPNGNITVSGFLDTGYEETFIFINADPEVLVEDLTLLQELCLESSEYSNIYNKNGKLIEAYSIYDIIVKAFDTVNKYCTVTRFKGLGEVNPEELKTIALDPKTRKIFRVSLPETDEEVDEIVANFMGGNKTVDFRKKFINAIFKDAFSDQI